MSSLGIKEMSKTEEQIEIFDKNNMPRLEREIAEIESKLKTVASELDERTIKLLNSRLSFLKEELEYLERN